MQEAPAIERQSERMSLRVSSSAKAAIESAASELGMTVNAFIVNLALEKASAVLMERRLIRLDDEARDRLFALLNDAGGPNDALKAAADEYAEGWIQNGKYHFEA